jgi:hypothetical protein
MAAAASLILLVAAGGCAGQGPDRQAAAPAHYPECRHPTLALQEERARIASDARVARARALGKLMTGDARHFPATWLAEDATLDHVALGEAMETDRATRFRTYERLLGEASGRLDKALASVGLATACYKEAYGRLSPVAGAMPKPEALARLMEIRDGSEDAKRALAFFWDASAKDARTLSFVLEEERARTPDKGSASQIGAFDHGLSRLKAKAGEARILDQRLDQIILAAGNDIARLSAGPGQPPLANVTASLPGQGPAPF